MSRIYQLLFTIYNKIVTDAVKIHSFEEYCVDLKYKIQLVYSHLLAKHIDRNTVVGINIHSNPIEFLAVLLACLFYGCRIIIFPRFRSQSYLFSEINSTKPYIVFSDAYIEALQENCPFTKYQITSKELDWRSFTIPILELTFNRKEKDHLFISIYTKGTTGLPTEIQLTGDDISRTVNNFADKLLWTHKKVKILKDNLSHDPFLYGLAPLYCCDKIIFGINQRQETDTVLLTNASQIEPIISIVQNYFTMPKWMEFLFRNKIKRMFIDKMHSERVCLINSNLTTKNREFAIRNNLPIVATYGTARTANLIGYMRDLTHITDIVDGIECDIGNDFGINELKIKIEDPSLYHRGCTSFAWHKTRDIVIKNVNDKIRFFGKKMSNLMLPDISFADDYLILYHEGHYYLLIYPDYEHADRLNFNHEDILGFFMHFVQKFNMSQAEIQLKGVIIVPNKFRYTDEGNKVLYPYMCRVL